jgi:hypothetical protein
MSFPFYISTIPLWEQLIFVRDRNHREQEFGVRTVVGMADQNYQDLRAWKQAMDLVLAIYRCTESFPRSEMFGLVAQMRRPAVPVPSNIA